MTKITKSLLISLICTLVLALSAIGCANSEKSAADGSNNSVSKKYTMKLGHDQNESTPHHEAALLFKKTVEEKTKGNVKVDVFPAQQLGSAREEIEGLQLGSVEAVALPTAAFSGFDLAMSITDLPFLFPNREICYATLDGPLGQKLLSRLESKGIKGAAFWSSGFKQLTGNFPITDPSDYKGKKIRVMSNPILIAQYQAMGASAVPIDFQELYNALQQGAVDGQENPITTIASMKFYEVQSHMTISNHGFLGYIFAFSNKWFETLPKEYQDIVLQAAKDSAVFERTQLEKAETEKYLPIIQKVIVNMDTLTSEQRKKFEDATKPAYQALTDKLDEQGKQLMTELISSVQQVK